MELQNLRKWSLHSARGQGVVDLERRDGFRELRAVRGDGSLRVRHVAGERAEGVLELRGEDSVHRASRGRVQIADDKDGRRVHARTEIAFETRLKLVSLDRQR